MRDAFVVKAARALAALQPPGRLLVAVSGGADSVALLDALAHARYRRDLRALEFVAAHVDHGLRPDSHLDAELVQAHAARLAVPYVGAQVHVKPERRGLEEAAREARYAALVRLARETGCGGVVTGHTASDQAETLLWNLARGAGARGLAAMAPRRALDGLVLLRPLLGVVRAETRARCARAGLQFRDDPTNEDERPRARLRAEVLPVLERLAPGAQVRLAAAAARFREDEELLTSLCADAARDASASALAALPPALRSRALAMWAERQLGSRRRLGEAHLLALARLVVSGRGEVELPAGPAARITAFVRQGRLAAERRPHRAGTR